MRWVLLAVAVGAGTAAGVLIGAIFATGRQEQHRNIGMPSRSAYIKILDSPYDWEDDSEFASFADDVERWLQTQ